MTNIDVLRELWSEFTALPLPEQLPEEITSAINVELLVATASDCIESYLSTGMLSPRENGALRACAIEVKRIRPGLDGDAARYFERLANLIGQVMTRPNLPGFFG